MNSSSVDDPPHANVCMFSVHALILKAMLLESTPPLRSSPIATSLIIMEDTVAPRISSRRSAAASIPRSSLRVKSGIQ